MLGPKPDVPEHKTWHFEIMNFGDPLGIVRAGAEQGKGRLLAQMIGGTREAEGRLMAAAPDLLEAAQEALALLTDECQWCERQEDDRCVARSYWTMKKLRAAITKAKGGKPE